MKFLELMEELHKREENFGRIIIVRCGVFMTAVGKDAIFLNRMLGLRLTCVKPEVCKVGIPINSLFKYMDMLEEKFYSYAIYDYDKETKKIILKYLYNGRNNILKEDLSFSCKDCESYKEKNMLNNMDIFELLEQREKRNKRFEE